MKIVGIAGGSGSGKSTLAVALCKKHPTDCAIIHVDDYFAKKDAVPKMGSYVNWDHPGAIRFGDLLADLKSLQEGTSVTVSTRSELYNPTYDSQRKNSIDHRVEPAAVMIVEGFLAFYDARIRNIMDVKIYLDIPIAWSIQRRSANKFSPSPEYFEKILIPMHEQFVVPTKKWADIVIDVGRTGADKALAQVEPHVFNRIV